MDQIKKGEIISVIGVMGCGKTPTIQGLIENSGFNHKVIYDPRREYLDFENAKIYHKFSLFKDDFLKFQNSFILIEEGSSVITSMVDLDLQESIISCGHYHNTICFVFHRIMECPQYILQKSKYIILFPTLDKEMSIKTERDIVYPYFLHVKKHKKRIIIKNF